MGVAVAVPGRYTQELLYRMPRSVSGVVILAPIANITETRSTRTGETCYPDISALRMSAPGAEGG
jgi:hypothetical protein